MHMRSITRETVKNKEEYNLGVREREPRYSNTSKEFTIITIHYIYIIDVHIQKDRLYIIK